MNNQKAWIHICPESDHFTFLFVLMSKHYTQTFQYDQHWSILFECLNDLSNKRDIQNPLFISDLSLI